jgi:hypothetical protein
MMVIFSSTENMENLSADSLLCGLEKRDMQ